MTSIFIYALLHYPKILSFVSGILAEELLLFLAFLSGHHLIDFAEVFFFGLLGAICIDSLYYLIVKTKLFHKYIAKRVESLRSIGIIKRIDTVAHHNIFLALFLSKFIYGPRTLAIVNFASRGMSYRKLMTNDLGALAAWFVLMMPLAWAAGHGLISSYSSVKEIEKIIGIAIVFIVAIYFIAEHIIFRILMGKKRRH